MTELRGQDELSLSESLNQLAPCDLVLVEGFKGENFAKLEIHRPDIGKPLLFDAMPGIIAIAADKTIASHTDDVPILDLNNLDELENWVLEFLAWPN